MILNNIVIKIRLKSQNEVYYCILNFQNHKTSNSLKTEFVCAHTLVAHSILISSSAFTLKKQSFLIYACEMFVYTNGPKLHNFSNSLFKIISENLHFTYSIR